VAKTKVLLIEDNRLLREGITDMLNGQEDIRAISSAGNKDALDKARKLMPDVVLLDLGLKSDSCLSVLESIKKICSQTEVVVMDLIPAQSQMVEFLNSGASGYIRKDATIADFLNTIRSVAHGVTELPPTMTNTVLTKIVERAIQEGKVNHVIASVKLTKREKDVIRLLADGHSIEGASNKLKVSIFTIKSNLHNILEKLAIHSRLEQAIVSSKDDLNKKS